MEDTMRNTPPSQSRAQKHKNYRHLQTDARSVNRNPTMPEICVGPLENQDAWGTGRKDHAHMGVRSCADHQRCHGAVS
jgi:hypothetical protein